MTTDVKKLKKDAYNKDECVISPPVDIYETEDEYVLKTDLPGVKKEDVDITIHDNKLEINAKIDDNENSTENLKYSEYSTDNYYRSFNVGTDINSEEIKADLEEGVLTLHLPKKPEVKPKKIAITSE